MQHDRAGPARHEAPVLPSRDVNQVLTCARASDHEHLDRRLQRGGAPRRLLYQASSDPRVVRRGHSSFPPARGQQCCIRGRYRPRRELRLGAWLSGEPRQAGPGRRSGADWSASGRGGESRSPCPRHYGVERAPSQSLGIHLIPTYWFERTAARSYDRTTTVGHRHRGGLEIS